ncbi:hypothetical protein [uncultured Cellulomonas sp.]|uniref:hypothetical protein n=1 Tax=uncultured Cellulomonas sp. TaxID=189682 RepID=UPI0028E49E06|nr:hypothetical protein [uncultured Cellulomonas sp.]
MQTTYAEGWLRLEKNDRRQHFFRDGMSVCGRFVIPTTRFPEDDGPDRGECPGCRHIFDAERGQTDY